MCGCYAFTREGFNTILGRGKSNVVIGYTSKVSTVSDGPTGYLLVPRIFIIVGFNFNCEFLKLPMYKKS